MTTHVGFVSWSTFFQIMSSQFRFPRVEEHLRSENLNQTFPEVPCHYGMYIFAALFPLSDSVLKVAGLILFSRETMKGTDQLEELMCQRSVEQHTALHGSISGALSTPSKVTDLQTWRFTVFLRSSN